MQDCEDQDDNIVMQVEPLFFLVGTRCLGTIDNRMVRARRLTCKVVEGGVSLGGLCYHTIGRKGRLAELCRRFNVAGV